MARETKSNGQKDILDRFYTLDAVVKQCIELLDLTQYDCIIEPSAGCGSFSNLLPNSYNYDIAPAAENIIQADQLQLNKQPFKQYNNILIIGNPPFGQQNALAIQFFNESAKIANTIAFILPLSFKKTSIQNRLSLDFHLIKELDLNNCEFNLLNQQKIQVPCVFQIWEKQSAKRKKESLKITSELFNFVDKKQADLRIQRVGGNAGKASLDLDRASSSNYFIKNKSKLTNDEFIKFVNSLIFPTIEFAVGPKSLSKGELVAVIEENYKWGE